MPFRALRLPSMCRCLRSIFTLLFSCVAIVVETPTNLYAAEIKENYTVRQVQNESFIRPAALTQVRILKSEVLGNIHCQLTSGYGAAKNLGVVKLPRGEEMDFAVLDQSGTRFSGSLSINPNHTRIGRHSDGSTIVGFGELRLNSGVFKPPDTPEPIRILRDGRTIFESTKAWDFDVAADGSSFVVHEPGPNRTSRLIVRDLESGNETRYDLGTKYTPFNDYESDYALRYSIDFTEVGFIPAYADAWGVGDHSFFPINHGKPRHISVQSVRSAILSSSTNGYFVDLPKTTGSRERSQFWTVYRKELHPEERKENVIWRRTIELDHFSRNMQLSPNGRWLVLSAWEYVVLSAETGETRFRYRAVDNIRREFERLRSVLPDGATVSDIGSIGGASFFEDYLIFSRSIGTAKGCALKPGQAFDRTRYRECLRLQRLAGRYRWFHDVFDLNEVSVDGGPIFRREIFRDTSCSEANSRLPGLIVRNGVLAYGIAEEFRNL